MDSLSDIISYFYAHYWCRNCLSVAWVKDLLYLADWKSVLLYGSPITHVKWMFGDHGPESSEISDAIIKYREDNPFCTIDPDILPDTIKEQIPRYNISSSVEKVLNHVVMYTSDLDRNGLTKLVYSTFPMLSRPRYAVFDMEKIAIEYTEFRSHMRPLVPRQKIQNK